MTINKKIHPEQFKMFMTPDEIKGYITDSVDNSAGSPTPRGLAALWHMKGLDDNAHAIKQSVIEEGVHKPVIIQVPTGAPTERWMGNGHHRVETTHQVQKSRGRQQYIPVIHSSDYMGRDPASEAVDAPWLP